MLTDPDAETLAQVHLRATDCPVHIVAASAESLPFHTASFDEVVATLVFCTIPHPESAFEEIRRVLKPGGKLRMLEHVRTPRQWVARLQDLLTPAWRYMARGCHLNRRPLETATAHGFIPVDVHRGLDGWLIAAELLTPTS